MLYYIIRDLQETKEKREALREIRLNGWRSVYAVPVRSRRWNAYRMNKSSRRR